MAQMVKNLPGMWETCVQSLIWEDPLEKGMTTHSSIFAWKIQWTEDPGRLQSMESQRVGHNWVTNILPRNPPWSVVCQVPLSMGILQERILKWVATPTSRRSSQPRDQTQISCIAGRFFTIWATREAPNICIPMADSFNVWQKPTQHLKQLSFN